MTLQEVVDQYGLGKKLRMTSWPDNTFFLPAKMLFDRVEGVTEAGLVWDYSLSTIGWELYTSINDSNNNSLSLPPYASTYKAPICECGAASIGFKESGRAHSGWCPLHER